jgi:hypothetical protein
MRFKGAVLSPDEAYRYSLVRASNMMRTGKTALWIGVNPSTAHATVDDASIRKLYGFAKVLEIDNWLVGNLFAYRATDVKELAGVEDPVGPDNDGRLRLLMREAQLVIVGWGRADKVPPRLQYRWREIVRMAEEEGCKLMCWGTCSDGHPRHPLMLAYTTPLEPWEPPQ